MVIQHRVLTGAIDFALAETSIGGKTLQPCARASEVDSEVYNRVISDCLLKTSILYVRRCECDTSISRQAAAPKVLIFLSPALSLRIRSGNVPSATLDYIHPV